MDCVVRLHQIDEAAGGALLYRRLRRHHHVLPRLQQQAGIDELLRKQRVVGVGEHRPQLHSAGRTVDLVIGGCQRSGGDQLAIGPVIGRDRQRARRHLLLDFVHIVFRQGEHHRNRLQLRYHEQAGGVAGLHIVTDVHQPDPDAAIHRGDDVAIGQVELGTVHRTLIGQHGAFVLLDQIDLVFDLLARNAVLPVERLVARIIRLRLVQQPGVLGQRALRLLQCHLIRPGIDLGEEIPLVHHLPFGEGDLLQLAVDLRDHGDRGQRRHRAEPGQHHVHVPRADGGHADGLRRPPRPARRSRRLLPAQHPPGDQAHDADHHQPQDQGQPWAAAARHRGSRPESGQGWGRS